MTTTTIPPELLTKPLREIAAVLSISHETVRRLRNQMRGRCQLCGVAAPYPGTSKCLTCLKRNRRKVRQVRGTKAWKPGSRGRRPVEAGEGELPNG